MSFINNQFLPSSGPERDKLREKGQFWTPSWVADSMVSYVLNHEADHIFDPAVGSGVFFCAAKKYAAQKKIDIKLLGTEIDTDTFSQGAVLGLTNDDFLFVEKRDFILDPPLDSFDAIVANPPYIRHHRLSNSYKQEFLRISNRTIGHTIDGRAGVHIYFLLQSLSLLAPGGRLSFIMPADTCEGLFADSLWRWITNNFCLDAVLCFDEDATPFPSVDTNALVFFINNSPPKSNFKWAVCRKKETSELLNWVINDFHHTDDVDLVVYDRSIEEGLFTGFSRPPRVKKYDEISLINFASTSRGVASGANEYFLFTKEKAEEFNIPDQFLTRVISRTRDVRGDVLTSEMLMELDRKSVPTFLLTLDGRNVAFLPVSVQDYIKKGEQMGLPKRALISQRNPWYKMERRAVPPILFAYLGRRNCRFILNEANVVPLTGFLCVYPLFKEKQKILQLFFALNHPETINNLGLVGKSYGSGAIKVEPRMLEKLPIPTTVLTESGLCLST